MIKRKSLVYYGETFIPANTGCLSLDELVRETNNLFGTCAPSEKKPKIKPGISPYDVEKNIGEGELWENFLLSYDSLLRYYFDMLNEQGLVYTRILDFSATAWGIFEHRNACTIFFGYNPQIENLYIRVFSVPPPTMIVSRYKSFALAGYPAAAFLWTERTDLSPKKPIVEILQETCIAFSSLEMIP